MTGDVYRSLRVSPVINACGIYTDLGGSRLSPSVWAAMTQANGQFARMPDLLRSAGRQVAAQLGAEAGTIVPGAAAGIALMVAAARAGTDGARGERLPLGAAGKSEVVIQHNHRYKYDRLVALAGASLVTAGTSRGTTAEALARAVGAETAAVLLPAHLDGAGGTLPLAEVAALTRARGLPLLVDAAYLCWPLQRFSELIGAGADLLCASAKYFGGPNAGGFVIGRQALVDAVVANDFTGYESGRFRTFGRPFKMDRQTVVGVVAALEEWRLTDHEARWRGYRRMAEWLVQRLAAVPAVRAEPVHFTMDERVVADPVNAVRLSLAGGRASDHAAALAVALAEGDPAIVCIQDQGHLIFCFDTLDDTELALVGKRLTALLAPEETE